MKTRSGEYLEWTEDLDAAQEPIEYIKKYIFDKSRIISIEKSNNETLIWLDKYSGIDWFCKNDNNQVIAVAARIQWDCDYGTFTIRFKRKTGTKTEFEKRTEAIRKGYMYPQLTMQAYFIRNPLKMLSACIIKTKDLYDFIEYHPDMVYDNKSDNDFKYVFWKDLERYGIKIWKY